MAYIKRVKITNYRSIEGPADITVPAQRPLVLVGENNAGKSNIVRAIELVLGESWPGSREPDDHDYFDRDLEREISVRIELVDVVHEGKYGARSVEALTWRFPPDEEMEKVLFMTFDDGETSGWVSNATREQCLCLLVSADRRLSWQLSYSSKFTLLSKLMRQFHKSLTRQTEIVEELRARFKDIVDLFAQVEEFSTFTAELEQQVQNLSGNLTYGLEIDFSAYDPSNFFHALRVQPSENGEPRTLEELGTGQEQILAIAFAHAYAKAFHGEGRTLVMVIEEPEAHLHPLAQRWIATQLRELAESDGAQVILTTHSPAFIQMLDLDGLVLVRKQDGGTTATQLTADRLAEWCRERGAARATADTILPFYAVASTTDVVAGFFASRIVLVEGPTEAEALPILLTRVGLDVLREGVAVISVQGVGNLAKWVRLFSAYGLPVFPIFDNDASADDDERRRNDLRVALRMESPDFEPLMESASELVLSTEAASFGEDFETTMRELFAPDYARLEEEAGSVYGLTGEGSKPLVARYVAEQLPRDGHDSAWEAMTALAEAIRGAESA